MSKSYNDSTERKIVKIVRKYINSNKKESTWKAKNQFGKKLNVNFRAAEMF